MTLANDRVADLDRRYLWHPFTQMRDWLAGEPLVIVAGEGNHLIDAQGRRYLDGVSSLWCNVHGHRHPMLDAAVRAQLDRVAHSTMLGLTHPGAAELAARLVQLAPDGLTRVFYSDAGATAVEIALKLAFQACQLRGETERTRFASLVEAYHGDTIGAISVGYSEAFHRFYRPLLFDVLRLTPPHVFRWQQGMTEEAACAAAIDEARTMLRAYGHELAALIVEPLVQGAAGMWTHPPEYLAELARLAREVGTLLICDEVATGFGRTGTLFACEQAGVAPDLLCVGKGITGGYLPLAATFASESLFETFLGPYEDFVTFFHGHTYTGNPLACAAGLASLDVFEQEQTMTHVQGLARALGDKLARDIEPLAHVGDVRRRGLMTGIELVQDRTTRAAYPPAAKIGHRVCDAVRKHGVILRPLGSVIVLMPPLSLKLDELDLLVSATAQAIREVTEA
ncbi:adenosylmethionine--8-amino-7-oxononanoate transaminase [Candidatus Binatia bacterium]|jgi:adenosylmethionine-8-amino-7-oxononanoate aminotransferase|nr:adenosylmethionine--8-amino-7-oxononanoate transaminase [Candidatus Binatia bacterium]